MCPTQPPRPVIGSAPEQPAAGTFPQVTRSSERAAATAAGGVINFEPQKFHIGLIDFFTVLLPGAVGAPSIDGATAMSRIC